MSKSNIILKDCYNKGYRIKDGKIFSPSKKELKGRISKIGYKEFSYYYKKKCERVRVHRLVAYQKYKEKIFNKYIQVRHLDNNCLNNMEKNIAIGTQSENKYDVPIKKRELISKYASSFLRKFSDKKEKEIRNFHNSTKSYKQTMNKFKIPKSSLHYIINKKRN
jgi:hypothetical protein